MSLGDLRSGVRAGLRLLERSQSTNDEARDWIAQGAEDGATVVADFQTRGRGRNGREWHAPPGVNLSISQVFLAPLEHLRLVPILGGLATRAAIADRLPPVFKVGIKWPNDILVLGFKIAGILTEALTDPQPAAVLGIGINVNTRAKQFPGELRRPAASLRMLAGKNFSRAVLLENLLQRIERYRKIWRESPRSLVAEFADNCVTLGKRVLVHPPGREPFEATACAIAADGSLLCTDAGDNEISVSAGDVDPLES